MHVEFFGRLIFGAVLVIYITKRTDAFKNTDFSGLTESSSKASNDLSSVDDLWQTKSIGRIDYDDDSERDKTVYDIANSAGTRDEAKENKDTECITKSRSCFENMNSNHDNVDKMNAEKILYIGGLFDTSGDRESWLGDSELIAAQVAIGNVNEVEFIKGYTVQLLPNNTQCDPGVGTDAFYDLIYRRPRILMVMGSACSEVTETLAEIVPYWNLILISYASTSPALSEREKYKTFFRLAPTDSANNPARRLFIQNYGWDTVATVYENKEVFYLAMDDLSKTLDNHNISVKATVSFRNKKSEISAKMKTLKDTDARIIIGGFSEHAARQVLCEAYKLEMYGSRFVWLIVGDFVEQWWEMAEDTDCTTEELSSVAEGYFTVASFDALNGKGMSVTNITVEEFKTDYRAMNGKLPMSPYATSAYDTVWTIAMTLKEYLTQKGQTDGKDPLQSIKYVNGARLTRDLMKIMGGLSFEGLSGPISFQGPDRRGIAVVKQNQDGKMTTVAMYEPDQGRLNFRCPKCDAVNWREGKIPKDKIVIVLHNKVIEDSVFYVITSCCCVGIVASVCFLGFNLFQRKMRYIKLSSPTLNNVAVTGCILVYGGVIMLGFDDRRLQKYQFPVFCSIRAFLFAAGFSLSFGAMFTKTYRVHQIFTRANSGLIKNKLLKDKQLLFIIGALLILDSSLLVVWICVDPMKRHISNLTVGPSDYDIDVWYISQISTCHSNHIDKWLGVFYAYKGLLLVFGVYMAWETRNVKIPVLNDSQYIGMNVYNVVIMSAIVVVLSNILSHKPTMAYTLESAFIILSTSVTLCLLFVPKIYAIITSKGDPVIASSGIVVEHKTRRFVVDDRRDLYYRAEVQNRVYKREIVELDQEISRLERLLELPIQPYPKLTDELLHLLPESRVDPSPDLRRRRKQELERCNSISDGGEVCMGLSEETSDDQVLPSPPSQPAVKQGRRLSIREAATATARKLSDLRRGLSFRSNSRKIHFSDENLDSRNIEESVSQNELSFRGFSREREDGVETKPDGIVTNLNRKWYTDSTIYESSSEELDHRRLCRSGELIEEANIPLTKTKFCKLHVKITPSSDDDDNEEKKNSAETTDQKLTFGFNSLSVVQHKRRSLCSRTDGVLIRVTDVDSVGAGRAISKLKSIDTLIARERRRRIQKLQHDLVKIQKELKNLADLEYEVSNV